ncbi:MAG: hypothetical protein ACI9QD_000459 [Thermoproteota archaeon]|jgi:hypothetical protein
MLKKLLITLCLALLLLVQVSVSSTQKFETSKTQLYLMTSHHPHDFELIKPYITIEKDLGRIQLVKITKTLPKKVLSHIDHLLKPVNLADIKRYEPKKLKSSKVAFNETIGKILDEIKPEDVKSIVEKVSSYEKRAAGSEDNYQATLWIQSEFDRLGYRTELDCFRTRYCNVYAFKKGSDTEAKTILVEAHLDSVGKSFAGSDDNASGIAGLLMMAREVAKLETTESFTFFATNGEEKGLLGAKHYVKKMKRARTLNKIKFVINMDMIGYKSNGKFELETNQEFESDALLMSDLAQTYTSLTPVITIPAWGSDHVPFLENNIPTVLAIEYWKTKTPCYHTRCDKPEGLNYNYAADIIKINLATILHKTTSFH